MHKNRYFPQWRKIICEVALLLNFMDMHFHEIILQNIYHSITSEISRENDHS